MTNPVQDLVTLFNTDAGLALTKGTDLFQGHLSGPNANIEVNSVFISSVGGPEPTRVMGLGTEIRTALLQIMLRWSKFAAGNIKAQAIQNVLQDAAISGYLDIKNTESSPLAIGQDDNGHYIFMMICSMTYEESA